MIFDSHAHYDDKAFDEDRDELLSSFESNGIGYVTDVGADIESSMEAVKLAKKYPFVYAAVGLHPDAADENTEDNMKKLMELSAHKKVVAIGEIGLDYHYGSENKEEQKKCFEMQIELAKSVKKPIIVHSREAAEDTFNIAREHLAAECGGVIHCFSYSKEMAARFADMGFYIGVGGVLTFNNAKKLKETVEYLPLGDIVIETDCPYLAPVPNRGKRNSSLNLKYVVKAISEIKNIPEQEVIDVTCANAKKLYRIEEL